jgi:hypothetical protein
MKFSISEYLGFSTDDMYSILEREGYTRTELEMLKVKELEKQEQKLVIA